MMGGAAVKVDQEPQVAERGHVGGHVHRFPALVQARQHLRHRRVLREDGVRVAARPQDRQSFIECPGDKGPLASRIALRNWLTAHPQAKNVVGAAWDDGRAPGMVQALQDAGFTKNGVIVGRATTEDALKIIASGDPIFVADLNMGFPQWGPSMVALAEDIYEGKPVPTLTTPIESMVIGAASAKKTLKALYGK